MTEPDTLLSLAQALADPIRLVILQHLMGGAATVSELVAVTGASQPNVSNHLGLLRRRRLVRSSKQGRQQVYELKNPMVAHLIESLSALSAGSPAAVRPSPALMKARTCYDHLAGQIGVRLFDALLSRQAISAPTTLRTSRNPGSPIELGARGPAVFAELGIDLDEVTRGRKPYAFACRDWTEQRPHLGGRLGVALWGRFIELGWVTHRPGTRVVLVTASGRQGLRKALNIGLPK